MTDVIEEQSRKPKKPQTGNGGTEFWGIITFGVWGIMR